MFMTEKTDIKPSFGKTLEEVINLLNIQYDISDKMFSIKKIIVANNSPHAIKLLEQHPEYICKDALRCCTSEAGMYFKKKLDNDFNDGLSCCKFDTVDTYLEDSNILGEYNEYKFSILSSNPRAISILKRNIGLIDWNMFSLNTSEEALDLLEQFPERINFGFLSENTNPRAIAILRENIDKIAWGKLSANPCDEAVDLIMENKDRIDYYLLSKNNNPRAVELLKENPEKISWYNLCRNSCKEAVKLLADNPDKIFWEILCMCASQKEQVDIMRDHLHLVNWHMVSMNSSKLVFNFLEENKEKMVWYTGILNENIFETITTYDYAGIRGARHDLHSEFHAWAGHPIRMVSKWRDWGFDNYGVDEADSDLGEYM
jgi:hypothetical protein